MDHIPSLFAVGKSVAFRVDAPKLQIAGFPRYCRALPFKREWIISHPGFPISVLSTL
jgi:hypothetical protein